MYTLVMLGVNRYYVSIIQVLEHRVSDYRLTAATDIQTSFWVLEGTFPLPTTVAVQDGQNRLLNMQQLLNIANVVIKYYLPFYPVSYGNSIKSHVDYGPNVMSIYVQSYLILFENWFAVEGSNSGRSWVWLLSNALLNWTH